MIDINNSGTIDKEETTKFWYLIARITLFLIDIIYR